MNANFIASIPGYRYIWTFSVASPTAAATFFHICMHSFPYLSFTYIATFMRGNFIPGNGVDFHIMV